MNLLKIGKNEIINIDHIYHIRYNNGSTKEAIEFCTINDAADVPIRVTGPDAKKLWDLIENRFAVLEIET